MTINKKFYFDNPYFIEQFLCEFFSLSRVNLKYGNNLHIQSNLKLWIKKRKQVHKKLNPFKILTTATYNRQWRSLLGMCSYCSEELARCSCKAPCKICKDHQDKIFIQQEKVESVLSCTTKSTIKSTIKSTTKANSPFLLIRVRGLNALRKQYLSSCRHFYDVYAQATNSTTREAIEIFNSKKIGCSILTYIVDKGCNLNLRLSSQDKYAFTIINLQHTQVVSQTIASTLANLCVEHYFNQQQLQQVTALKQQLIALKNKLTIADKTQIKLAESK